MKIAVVGKGGTGKSFIAASLARLFAGGSATADVATAVSEAATAATSGDDASLSAQAGQVYALDADPCGGLGAALGLSQAEIDNVKPIVDMREFFEPGKEDGELYLSAPDIGSVGGQYNTVADGVNFLRMAYTKRAGAGCYCQEYGFLQALLKSMLLGENDVLILDMPPGVEHFSRGTIRGVDMLLIVAEATRACIETSRTIRAFGADLGIPKVFVVANKVRNEKEELLIRACFRRGELIGLVRMSEAIADQSIGIGSKSIMPPYKALPDVEELYQNLLSFK